MSARGSAIPGGPDPFAQFNQFRAAQLAVAKANPVLTCANGLTFITALVTSILAVCGVMSGVAFGSTLLGLAGVSVVSYFLTPKEHRQTCCTLMGIALYIIFGALAVAGVVTGVTAGWVILGPLIAVVGCSSYLGSCGSYVAAVGLAGASAVAGDL